MTTEDEKGDAALTEAPIGKLLEELREMQIKGEGDLQVLRIAILKVLKIQEIEESFFVGTFGSLTSFLDHLLNSEEDVIETIACMLEEKSNAAIEEEEAQKRKTLSVEALIKKAAEEFRKGKSNNAYQLEKIARERLQLLVLSLTAQLLSYQER